jgi:hypothetical protein
MPVPQGRRIFSCLTVKKNLAIAAGGSDAQGWDFEKIYVLFPRLEERHNQRVSTPSGGEQQIWRLPEPWYRIFLFMDEPTEGLAPAWVGEVGDVILRLKEGGVSIFLVERTPSGAAFSGCGGFSPSNRFCPSLPRRTENKGEDLCQGKRNAGPCAFDFLSYCGQGYAGEAKIFPYCGQNLKM